MNQPEIGGIFASRLTPQAKSFLTGTGNYR
jgi:hypothetical protein